MLCLQAGVSPPLPHLRAQTCSPADLSRPSALCLSFMTTTNKTALNEHGAKHEKTGLEAFGEAAYNSARDGKAK